MVKHSHPPAAAETLVFYPTSSDQFATGSALIASTAIFLAIPVLLLIGIMAPFVVLHIPFVWICCKLSGVKFRWNLSEVNAELDAAYLKQKQQKSLQ